MTTLALPPVRGKLTANAPLAPLVWFKSGGTAEQLFEPKDLEDLQAFLRGLDASVPVMALGLGLSVLAAVGQIDSNLRSAIARDLPQVQLDAVHGERMVQHLLRTMVSVAPAGEAVTGACWFQPDGGEGRVVLAIDRPSSLAGLEEAQLLDPAYVGEGDWADGPLLGLGFSLRLIRGLATTCGGALFVEAGRILLTIPAVGVAEDNADIG